MGNDGRLQIGLGVAGLFLKAEKLQHVGVFEQVLRLGDVLSLPRQVADRLLIAAEGQPLIEASIELAPEFAQSPALLGCLNFVEVALFLFEAEQEYTV